MAKRMEKDKSMEWDHIRPRSYWDALDRLHSMKEVRCKYVPMTCRKGPDELTKEEAAYYVHWRNALWKGKLLKADENYVWLWIVETADRLSEHRLFDIYGCMAMLVEGYEQLGGDLTTLEMMAVAGKGMPICSPADDLNIGIGLAMLPIPFEERVMGRLLEEGEDPPGSEMMILFSSALAFIDSELRGKTGKGLVERLTHTDLVGISVTFPLRDHDGLFVFETPSFLDCEAAWDFLRGVFRNVRNVYGGGEVEEEFGFFRDAINMAFGDDDVPEVPVKYGSFSLTDTNGDGSRPCTTVIFQRMPDRLTVDDVVSSEMRRAEAPDSNPGYVESLSPEGKFVRTKRSRDYYAYWRKCVLEGRFLDTDVGYLTILRAELSADRRMDNREKMDLYHGLCTHYRAFGGFGMDAMSLSMSTGLPLPRPDAYPPGNSYDLFMDGLVSINRYGPTSDDLKVFVAETWQQALFTDEDSVDIFRRFMVQRNDETRVDDYDSIPGSCHSGSTYLLDPQYAGSYIAYMMAGLKSSPKANGYSQPGCSEYLAAVLDSINMRVAKVKGTDHPLKDDPDVVEGVEDLLDSCVERHFMSGGRAFEATREYVPSTISVEGCRSLLSHVPVEPCPFVPCGDINPRPDMFSEEQRRYYVYWSSRLSEGECLATEVGYIHCRLNELLTCDMPMEDRLAEIDTIEAAVPMPEYLYYVNRVRCLVLNGYLTDRIEFEYDTEMTDVGLSDLLSHPPAHIGGAELNNLLYIADVKVEHDDQWDDTFNRMLQALSTHLVTTYGVDIPEYFSEGYTLRSFTPEYPLGTSRPEMSVTVGSWKRDDGWFSDVIHGLADCCNKALGGKGKVPIRRKFTRSMYDAVMSGYTDQSTGTSRRGTVIGRASRNRDGILVDTGCMSIHLNDGTDMSDVYIPSDTNRGYDPGVSAYYRWWVDEIGKGNRPIADRGYLMRYIQTVERSEDVSAFLDVVRGLRADYDPLDRDEFLLITMFRICDGKKIPVDDSGHTYWEVFAYIVLWQIVSGKGGRLSAESLDVLGGLPPSVMGDMTEGCLDAVNTCIAECAARCGNKLTAFRDLFGIRVVKSSERFYSYNLEYQSIRDLEGSGFRAELRSLAKAVSSAIRGGKVKVEPFGNLEPEDIRRIVDGCKGAATTTVRRRTNMPMRDVVLDTKAVTDAESDLAHVTELMRTEESSEERVRTPVVEERKAVTDDPWADLASALSAEERDVLLSAITVSSPSPIPTRMSDSINAKALDTVGDTVIEDGVPIEDYLDELRSVLGRADTGGSDPYAELMSLLTEEEREYVALLSRGGRTRGRRPEKRISSINGKSLQAIGSDLITDGSIPEEHAEHIRGTL